MEEIIALGALAAVLARAHKARCAVRLCADSQSRREGCAIADPDSSWPAHRCRVSGADCDLHGRCPVCLILAMVSMRERVKGKYTPPLKDKVDLVMESSRGIGAGSRGSRLTSRHQCEVRLRSDQR
jgi:hypothetical protein